MPATPTSPSTAAAASAWLSARSSALQPSLTLAIAAKAKQLKANGPDICSLSAGEPDFDTPAFICEAAALALANGQTRYGPAAGEPALREAIAAKLRRENGIDCTAAHVAITAGAKHALYLTLQTLVDPGDEVILPTPAWVSYRPLIELAGGRCVEVPGAIENGHKVTPAQLEAAMTPRTVAVILNSPSNPCGTAYSPDEVRALCEAVARHPKAAILSDEIYEKLIYPENSPTPSRRSSCRRSWRRWSMVRRAWRPCVVPSRRARP